MAYHLIQKRHQRCYNGLKLVNEICKLCTSIKQELPLTTHKVKGWSTKQLCIAMLANCTKGNPLDRKKHVYNSIMHVSAGYIPFYLISGYQARLSVDMIYGTTNTSEQAVTDYARTLRS